MKRLSRAVFVLITAFYLLNFVSTNARADSSLASTIFAFDGTDFVRTATTLTDGGKSAVNTKLDQRTAAYRALIAKRAFVGRVKIFDQEYDANYAPLVGVDGKLTGALFVGIPRRAD